MAPGVPLSEDCLFIDVWTPARTPGEKLPVIAWIYGGGFTGGMTSAPLYDGKNFASKGVVLGHSAGGFAVSMLAGSPLAKGLFRGVISESGANFMPPEHSRWAGGSIETLQAAEAAGKKWLDSLGAPTLAQARALPAEKVDEAQRAEGAPRFWPPVDGYVIKADQYELWRQGRFNDTSILVGVVSDEAAAFGAHKTDSAAFETDVRTGYGKEANAILASYPHATDDPNGSPHGQGCGARQTTDLLAVHIPPRLRHGLRNLRLRLIDRVGNAAALRSRGRIGVDAGLKSGLGDGVLEQRNAGVGGERHRVIAYAEPHRGLLERAPIVMADDGGRGALNDDLVG